MSCDTPLDGSRDRIFARRSRKHDVGSTWEVESLRALRILLNFIQLKLKLSSASSLVLSDKHEINVISVSRMINVLFRVNKFAAIRLKMRNKTMLDYNYPN